MAVDAAGSGLPIRLPVPVSPRRDSDFSQQTRRQVPPEALVEEVSEVDTEALRVRRQEAAERIKNIEEFPLREQRALKAYVATQENAPLTADGAVFGGLDLYV